MVKSESTLANLQDGPLREPDLTDRASSETDWAIELRTRDRRTLREVSEKAGVSLGYLSEVERGQKEASSELLSSIADALGVSTSRMLRMVADYLDSVEG